MADMTQSSTPEKIEVTQEDRNAAIALSEYAGFQFAADHLDMAIEAATEAFAPVSVARAGCCGRRGSNFPTLTRQ